MPDAKQWRRRRTSCTSRSRCDADGALSHVYIKEEERRNPTMYKILKSTDQGLDELELEHLEKGYWLDIVAPSVEELQEIAAATKIQMDFLSAALDEEE